MNRAPEAFVPVGEERLLEFSTACLCKAGLPRPHAALVSRLLVNADLRGVRSHGTRQVDGYCTAFERGALNPDPQVTVISEAQAVVALDGDGSLGYLPMVRATQMAIERARSFGLGMATVRAIGHYGSAGHYGRMCMEAGCIGFSVQGGEGHGNARGRDPKPQLGYYGNPPICFALPGGDGPPVVLDAATCILADDQRGAEYDALLGKIPAAFFKSVGYTAVAALLGGGLAGVTVRDAQAKARWPGARGGGMVLAIRIGAVVAEDAFRAEVDRLGRDVAETYSPLPGYDRALLPGAIEEERLALHRREGIRYGEPEQEAARRVSRRLGVPLPWG